MPFAIHFNSSKHFTKVDGISFKTPKQFFILMYKNVQILKLIILEFNIQYKIKSAESCIKRF